MLTQTWIDRVMASGLDSPDVVGPPREELDDTKDAWTLRYCARFVERGVPLHIALAEYRAVDDHDYDDDPAQAADEAMSYWDGDESEGESRNAD